MSSVVQAMQGISPATAVALGLAGLLGPFLLNDLAGSMRSRRWCYRFKACSWVFMIACLVGAFFALFARVPSFVAWLAWAIIAMTIAAQVVAGVRWRRHASRSDSNTD